MPLHFTKMHGAGNDFLVIDNRVYRLDDAAAARLAQRACPRRFGVGADGLLLLDDSPDAGFRMRYYNADGSRAAFCGNGARCLARFAYRRGVAGASMTFESDDGLHRAVIEGQTVRISMADPANVRLNRPLTGYARAKTVHTLNTGADHAVLLSGDLEAEDVENHGRELRYHPLFHPAGTNVNFVRRLDASAIAVRTYERGVEAETLSCGSGGVAAVVAMTLLEGLTPPIKVHTRSGETLTVDFRRGERGIAGVTLQGSAHFVYDGELAEETFGEG